MQVDAILKRTWLRNTWVTSWRQAARASAWPWRWRCLARASPVRGSRARWAAPLPHSPGGPAAGVEGWPDHRRAVAAGRAKRSSMAVEQFGQESIHGRRCLFAHPAPGRRREKRLVQAVRVGRWPAPAHRPGDDRRLSAGRRKVSATLAVEGNEEPAATGAAPASRISASARLSPAGRTLLNWTPAANARNRPDAMAVIRSCSGRIRRCWFRVRSASAADYAVGPRQRGLARAVI